MSTSRPRTPTIGREHEVWRFPQSALDCSSDLQNNTFKLKQFDVKNDLRKRIYLFSVAK